MVVKCPYCGFAEMTTASKSFKCFGCGRIWQLKPDMILFSNGEFERAQEFLKRLKQGGGIEFRKAAEKFLED